MGFKYRKHEFRANEVVEPTRIRDNMQTLGNEFNGQLDRENLPVACIDSGSIKRGTFNRILQTVGDTSNKVSFSRTDSSGNVSTLGHTSFETIDEIKTDIKVDSVVVVHYGGQVNWKAVESEFDSLLAGSGALPAGALFNSKFSMVESNYADGRIVEHCANFRLTINGEVVCQVDNLSFLRTTHSIYMTGSLPVSAGSVEVKCEGMLFKTENGVRVASQALYFEVNHRNLLVHIKKR